EEVDVIEGVQELGAEFEIHPFTEPEPLDCAQIEAREHRAGDKEVGEATVPSHYLNAATAVGRRDIASRWRAAVAVTGRRSRAHIEGPDRVFNDVLRHEVGGRSLPAIRGQDRIATRVNDKALAHLERILEILPCHSDQSDVAHINIGAGLNARRAIPFPATNDLVNQAAGETAGI